MSTRKRAPLVGQSIFDTLKVTLGQMSRQHVAVALLSSMLGLVVTLMIMGITAYADPYAPILEPLYPQDPMDNTPASELLPVQPDPQVKEEAPALRTGQKSSRQNTSQSQVPVFTGAYQSVPAILVVPVIRHGSEKAYYDLPVLVANELTKSLEEKYPETFFHNPSATMHFFESRGLKTLYTRLVSSMATYGEPDTYALDQVLDELQKNGIPIYRVMFVDAHLDTSEIGTPHTWKERLIQWTTDSAPKNWHFEVVAQLDAYDTQGKDVRRVWSKQWSSPMNVDELGSVNASVFETSSSASVFRAVSRKMSREVFLLSPKELMTYWERDESRLRGRLAPGHGSK